MVEEAGAETHGDSLSKTQSSKVQRSAYALTLVILYIAATLFSSIVITVLTFRPITNSHYGPLKGDSYSDGSSLLDWDDHGHMWHGNEQWYRTARVIQAIVSVLTIPTASMVCASAAVIYSQRRAEEPHLSIRKVMVLADKSWVNPAMYANMLAPTGRRKYGSSFLFLAMAVNILGALIAPLQQIFLSTQSIKIPTEDLLVNKLFDLPDQFDGYSLSNNSVVLATRNALQSAAISQPQAQLWPSGNFSCDPFDYSGERCSNVLTLANMSTIPDPFLAQLPNGYNTGLIRQFAPRLNSTARVSLAEFPDKCKDIPGAFFSRRENPDYPSDTMDRSGWTVTACIPADIQESPWKVTRARQDFSEELYLNITTTEPRSYEIHKYVVKIVVDTTAGYFELPNYMNGGVPGPLLDNPQDEAGDMESFADQFMMSDFPNWDIPYVSSRHLNGNNANGPLRTIAFALFGPDSFLTTWPLLFGRLNNTDFEDIWTGDVCMALAPLGQLFMAPGGHRDGFASYEGPYPCSLGTGLFLNGPQEAILEWLRAFSDVGKERLTNAFNAAAFIANQAWVQVGIDTVGHSLHVYYDLGSDTQVPTISLAGLIIVWTLTVIFLTTLLGISLYAFRFPRWTDQLDSFAMMRIGGSVGSKVPLLYAREGESNIKVLDTFSGNIGDAEGEDEKVGRLTLDESVPLKFDRQYRSYEDDA